MRGRAATANPCDERLSGDDVAGHRTGVPPAGAHAGEILRAAPGAALRVRLASLEEGWTDTRHGARVAAGTTDAPRRSP